ncbi:hypothetical protein D3C73_1375120 [compost metagenome]
MGEIGGRNASICKKEGRRVQFWVIFYKVAPKRDLILSEFRGNREIAPFFTLNFMVADKYKPINEKTRQLQSSREVFYLFLARNSLSLLIFLKP